MLDIFEGLALCDPVDCHALLHLRYHWHAGIQSLQVGRVTYHIRVPGIIQ